MNKIDLDILYKKQACASYEFGILYYKMFKYNRMGALICAQFTQCSQKQFLAAFIDELDCMNKAVQPMCDRDARKFITFYRRAFRFKGEHDKAKVVYQLRKLEPKIDGE